VDQGAALKLTRWDCGADWFGDTKNCVVAGSRFLRGRAERREFFDEDFGGRVVDRSVSRRVGRAGRRCHGQGTDLGGELERENLDEIRKALVKGGNTRVTITELPDLNHLFHTCKTGAVSEYGEIEETLAPAALTLIGDWVVDQVKSKS
jgi:hypothetical protein